MDIWADEYKSNGKRPGPFLTILQTVRGFTKWLAGLVTLTDKDRKKAGIDFGGEGRDEQTSQLPNNPYPSQQLTMVAGPDAATHSRSKGVPP